MNHFLALLQAQTDWANRTNLHPLGVAFALTLSYGVLLLPRRLVPVLFITLATFIPAGQRLVVLTLDFSFLRILVLFGWLRIAIRRESTHLRLHSIDYIFLAWVGSTLTTYVLSRGTTGALIYRLGTTFDSIGLYVIFRCAVRSWRDLDQLAKGLALVSVVVFSAFAIESLTGRNLFSFLGGVPEFTNVRDGRLRCQGAFSHPILAGCFWAAALPLIVARCWSADRGHALAAIASLCTVAIVILTASSTPMLAMAFAGIGAAAYPARRHLGAIRLGLAACIVMLHLAMNAPVWHLLARVNVVGGSTGWHRYYLIDETIKHFDEWWLLGTPSTSHWGRGLDDVTNQYVAQAVEGGVVGLLLFVSLLVAGFRAVGHSWRAAWPNRARVALAWGLGVSLLVQSVAFVGVTFFDQTGVLFFLVLACLGSMRVSELPLQGGLDSSMTAKPRSPVALGCTGK